MTTRKKKIADRNEIVLRGTLVDVSLYQNRVRLKIATDGGRSGFDAFPFVTFYDMDKAMIYRIGDKVEIKGHSQTVSNPDENGKLRYTQFIVGDEIFPTRRILSEHLEELEGVIDEYDGGIPNDLNYGIIIGDVVDVLKSTDKMSLIIVNTNKGKHKQHRTTISCFKRQKKVADKLKKGDKVAIAFIVRTASTQKENTNISELYLTCQDIAIM